MGLKFNTVTRKSLLLAMLFTMELVQMLNWGLMMK